MIFAIRVTAGRENQVLDKLEALAKKDENKDVYAILAPSRIRGYIFLEAKNRDVAKQIVYGVSHVKGLVDGDLEVEDVEHFLEPGKTQINIQKDDVVELVSGPFKSEKAKVIRINPSKEDVVVELLEAAVPIPVTVKFDAVRVIRRKDDETA